MTSASVIVRVKDEATTLERTLRSLKAQTVQAEIIVVDSGSRDGSLEIARRYCDRLLKLPSQEFTYGRSLNLGAQNASAPVHFALSAHCWPQRDDWIALALRHYGRADVAGTGSDDRLPDGRPLDSPFFQDAAHLRANPTWGFSNHASSWRASVWREFPFDESLDYAEDREWAFRVLDAGWKIVFDPDLWVDMSHAWQGGSRDFFERQRRAGRALKTFADLPAYGPRELFGEWWRTADDGRRPAWINRFCNPRRLAGLAGKYMGRRG